MANVKYTLKSGTEEVTELTIDSWFDIMAERNNLIYDINNIVTDEDTGLTSAQIVIPNSSTPANNIVLLQNDVSQVKVSAIMLQDQTDVVNTRLDTVDEILATLTGTTNESKSGSILFSDFADVDGRYEYTVSLETPYPTTNYAVSVNYSTSTNAFILTNYGSKTTSQFKIYLSAILGADESIDWVTIPY
jgi:hypothetical protein